LRQFGHRHRSVVHRRAELIVAGCEAGTGLSSAGNQRTRGRHDWVARSIGAQFGGSAVRRLDIGSCVSAEADGTQMQEGRLSPRSHPIGELGRQCEHRLRVAAVDSFVAEMCSLRVRRRDPVGRRAHADSKPVVLADKQQRQRQALMRAMHGGVDRSGGDRVVG